MFPISMQIRIAFSPTFRYRVTSMIPAENWECFMIIQTRKSFSCTFIGPCGETVFLCHDTVFLNVFTLDVSQTRCKIFQTKTVNTNRRYRTASYGQNVVSKMFTFNCETFRFARMRKYLLRICARCYLRDEKITNWFKKTHSSR